MHVIADRSQITGGAAIYEHGRLAPAEEVAEKLVLAIETASLSTQKPFHAGGGWPWAFRRPDESDWT
jgi:hypothetical protein